MRYIVVGSFGNVVKRDEIERQGGEEIVFREFGFVHDDFGLIALYEFLISFVRERVVDIVVSFEVIVVVRL